MRKFLLIGLLGVALFTLSACDRYDSSEDEKADEKQTEMLEITIEELAMYDGTDGNPAYIAVDGVVYDVTDVSAWSSGSQPVWVNANEIDYADYSAAWKAVFSEDDTYYYIIALSTYYFYWDAGVQHDAVNTYTLTPVALVADSEMADPTSGNGYEFVTGVRMKRLTDVDVNEYCILFRYTGIVYKKEVTSFNENTTLSIGWSGTCEGVPGFGRYVESTGVPI